jgi:class 3 adenylate cyclase
MTLKIAELHHLAVRIAPGPDAVGAALRFASDVLGFEIRSRALGPVRREPEDQRRRPRPDSPRPGDDESGAPGAVKLDISALTWPAPSPRSTMPRRSSTASRPLPRCPRPASARTLAATLLADPAGNLIELHQLGTCRCTARARDGVGQARVSGTVLFADMRGFTAVAERLSPSDVVPLLNEYFSLLSSVTREHGGTVFHMAGDGLMAGFGLPLPADDASGRAVSAARGMITGFGKLAAEWKSRLGIETGIGIGINAGDVIVGDVGAPELPSYTLIGDTVNVAARLVQRARAGEALFSLSVKQSLDPVPTGIVELPPLVLRGRTRTVEIYCMESPTRLDLRIAAA